MEKIKMVFIGVGDMGLYYCIGFDLFEDSEVCYICDMNEVNVVCMLVEFKNSNFIIVSDYCELFVKEDLDVVVISVLNYLYCEVVVDFLEVGKYVFLEKLVVYIIEDCDVIIEVVEVLGWVLQIGLVYWYLNLYC